MRDSMPRKQRTPAETCADCGSPDPGWASLNRGVLICDECCSVHRSLGRHISQIRSLHHGPQWPRSLYEMVHALVSNGANSIWEHSLLDPSQVRSGKRKPNPKDPLHPSKSEFIRAKYSRLDFVHRLKDEDTVDLSKQLHSSVRTGNLETCLRLLSLGAQANFFHVERGNTPLHVASKEGQALQCELLMTYGADPGALDTNGQTPADLAREGGHLDLAERLTHSQYELTDRLTFYVCGKRPDHSSTNQHFLIPEMADSSLDRSEAAEQARKKLQALSNHLFEELAMDVYDEVDRRELDTIWSSLQKPSMGGGDRPVPFLPLNPELSSTRNQGRQKLARFSAREFATLIIDILKEARRRQQGTMSINRSEKEIIDVHREPPKPPAHKDKNAEKNNSMVDDNEPLYDLVASDEDYGELDARTPAESVSSPRENTSNGKDKRTESAASSDLSDGPITLEEYLEVKKQLAAAEAKVQQLLAMNKQYNQDLHMLQSMVDNLKKENFKLRAEQRPNFDELHEVLTELSGSLEHVDKLKEENTQLRTEQRQGDFPQKSRDLESIQTSSQPNNNRPGGRGTGRPMSMFEPRAPQKPFPIPTAKELLAGLPSRSLPVIKDNEKGNENTDQIDRPPSQAESDYDNTPQGQSQEAGSSQSTDGGSAPSTPTNTSTIEGASGGSDSEGAPEKRPSQESVVGATDRVTKRIQTLLLAAQEGKLDRFGPCSGDILSSVKEMATLFPEKPRSESVRQPLRTLVSNASRLQIICKNALPTDPKVTPDHQHLTQQIIACAYEIAKAAKQLVTCYQL